MSLKTTILVRTEDQIDVIDEIHIENAVEIFHVKLIIFAVFT